MCAVDIVMRNQNTNLKASPNQGLYSRLMRCLKLVTREEMNEKFLQSEHCTIMYDETNDRTHKCVFVFENL